MTTGFERHLRTFSRRNAWISPEMGVLPMRVIANNTLKKFGRSLGIAVPRLCCCVGTSKH